MVKYKNTSLFILHLNFYNLNMVLLKQNLLNWFIYLLNICRSFLFQKGTPIPFILTSASLQYNRTYFSIA
jgi:hypothetical protein